MVGTVASWKALSLIDVTHTALHKSIWIGSVIDWVGRIDLGISFELAGAIC